jgi:hypothetical protein
MKVRATVTTVIRRPIGDSLRVQQGGQPGEGG